MILAIIFKKKLLQGNFISIAETEFFEHLSSTFRSPFSEIGKFISTSQINNGI